MVCGGDGTVAAAVEEMAKSKSVLGVVPAGTGNSFASSLDLTTVETAIDAIAYGEEARVDVGCVNGKRFANFATIGLAADIGDHTPDWLKSLMGPLAYGFSALGPILRPRPFDARVRWKKHKLHLQTRQIIVVCGRDYGHTQLTPETTPVNGLLTFYARSRTSPLDTVQTYASFLIGAQGGLDGVHCFQAKKIRIDTSRAVRVAVDGADACRTPVRFSVEPRALRVMVPARAALV